MNSKTIPLDNQIKAAKRDKLLAEAERARAEKRKIDLEYEHSKKLFSRRWFQKKEFWSVFAGSTLALGTLGFYITYFVVPMSEIHNNQVTLENSKKSDTLYAKEKQLTSAFDSLNNKEIFLAKLSFAMNQQKNDNIRLKIARQKVDSSYTALYKRFNRHEYISDEKFESKLVELKQYFNDYKAELNRLNQSPGYTLSGTLLNSSDIGKYSDYFKGSGIANTDIKPIFTSAADPSFISTALTSDQPKFSFASNSYLNSEYVSSLDSMYKIHPISLSGILSTYKINIRPLLNGKLVKDIVIAYKKDPLSFTPSFGTPIYTTIGALSQNIIYKEDNGYVMDTSIDGSYTFSLNNGDYKITSIKTSDIIASADGNKVTFNGLSYNNKNITVDLLLEKN